MSSHPMNLPESSSSPAISVPRQLAQSSADEASDYQRIVGSPEQLSDIHSIDHSLATPRMQPASLATSSSDVMGGYFSIPVHPRTVSQPRTTFQASVPSTPTGGIAQKFRHSQVEQKRNREWTVFGELLSLSSDESMTTRPRSGALRNRIATGTPLDRPTSNLQTIPSSRTETEASSLVNINIEGSQSQSTSNLVLGESFFGPRSPTQDDNVSVSTDEDEPSEPPTPPSPADMEPKPWYTRFSLPALTPLQRNILKCSVAYFIGSLFTYSPYLSGLIADITTPNSTERAPSPSGHMVATVAVYFNPAKTMGAMVEADMYCAMALLYCAFVSLSSMSMFWFFEVQPGWEWLADTIVIIWVGLSMALVAWMKLWMAKPSFNTACSMTAIILFIVIVKEGGVEMLLQVSFIVVIGSFISNVVCYLLWPQKATGNLQNTMTKTLDSFSTLLTMFTQTFLLEEPHRRPTPDRLSQAIASHQASFTALKKNLGEAQSESWFGGPSKPPKSKKRAPRMNSGQAYEDAVDSLNRLGQHLNGLRSGTSLQYELIKANRDGKLVLRNRKRPRSMAVSKSGDVNGNGKGKDVNVDEVVVGKDEEDTAFLQASADTFGELVDDLGPPLKALSSTCATTLKKLRDTFTSPYQKPMDPEEFHGLADSLGRAMYTFESTANHAILRLYRSGTGGGPHPNSRASLASSMDENQMVMGEQSENVFLVYFFIFTLQEFAKELASLVDAMNRICSIQRAEAERRWWWLMLFMQPFISLRDMIQDRKLKGRSGSEKGLRKRLSSYFIPAAHPAAYFPKVTPHAPNTIQTPAREQLAFVGRIKQSIWAIGARLREPDCKYAFKTGMALAILASPAFFEVTRPVFVEFRGEWALISFFVVMSPTIGATNFLGLHRVLGTLIGAATAASISTAFPDNPYVLSIFGFFFSIPCFYYIVAKPQYATSARFVLLTYNLTALYCYNSRLDDLPVLDIAFRRFVAVTVGVVWAGIVSRYWWPAEARRELGKALGEFCLNIGWLYTRLVAFNSFADVDIHSPIVERPPTETTSLLMPPASSKLNDSIAQFMAMELHLQIKLIELQGLLAQTQHEPRLKGPFPIKLYRSILTSLQTILDQLHSMRCVTSREEWHTTVHKDFIMPVNRERREMVGNVLLYFSTLGSAFRLKSPLPPYLPPAEKSRQRLVDAIRQLDVIRNRDIKGSRQLLFFAYALTMRGVIHELDYLGATLQDAFGVIGGSIEAFETLFERANNAV